MGGRASPWVRFEFVNEFGEPFGVRIHRAKSIGVGFIECDEGGFRIRDNRILGDVIFSGEEFAAIARAWQEVTGAALEKPAWLAAIDLVRAMRTDRTGTPGGI